MAYKRATLKRTSVVKSAAKAAQWVRNYIDETKKHKDTDLSEIGAGIGKNYFTSRPIGMISAHGYAEHRVARLKQVQKLPNNEAVLTFLREYCTHHKEKGRKIIGLRMILSLDPEKVTELCRDKVDIDRLIVGVAEKTFAKVGELYYPGDEIGFILALHHDAETYRHTTSRRKFILEHGREPGPEDCKPHIHAHLLVLSHTKLDRRINLSDRALVDRSAAGRGERLDRLTAIREYYQQQVAREIYHYRTPPVEPVAPLWAPIIREASTLTLEDFIRREPAISDRKELRRRVVNRYRWYIASLDKEKLEKQAQDRRKALLDQRRREAANSEKFRAETQKAHDKLMHVFKDLAVLRTESADKVADAIKPSANEFQVEFFDSPTGGTVVSASSNFVPTFAPDRTAEIKKLLDESETVGKVNRIQSLAEVTLLSLKLRAASRNPEDPAWLNHLSLLVRTDRLPNSVLPPPSPDWAPNATQLQVPPPAANPDSRPSQPPPRKDNPPPEGPGLSEI